VSLHRGYEVDDGLISFSVLISHIQKEMNRNDAREILIRGSQSLCVVSVVAESPDISLHSREWNDEWSTS
jgi:hypothetical protein